MRTRGTEKACIYAAFGRLGYCNSLSDVVQFNQQLKIDGLHRAEKSPAFTDE